jgi:transcriptional regulator
VSGDSEEYLKIQKSIIELEKELLEKAPDNIKKLYLQIDFLCCRQQEIAENLLKEY